MKRNGRKVVCIKTDAVVYVSQKPMNIENEFWDDAKTIPKYKFEEPSLLKNVISYSIEDKFIIEDKKIQYHS